MRLGVDKDRLLAFMRGLGAAAEGPGTVYIVGGSSALILSIRDQTIDIDLKLDPEPRKAFEAIAKLKERLSINVELASPDHFLPELPDWRERSTFIARHGQVDFYHYDFYAQTLSKILRGHDKDLDDANALVRLGEVDPHRLLEFFTQIEAALIRYPGIDRGEFKSRVQRFVEGHEPR
jgi:hypothetical protein